MYMSARKHRLILQHISGERALSSVKGLGGFKVYFSNTLHLFVQAIAITLPLVTTEITVIIKRRKEMGAEVIPCNL